MSQTMKIVPDASVEDGGRTGRLSGITVTEIDTILGFTSNRRDDPAKVRHSWGFSVNGHDCAIWDYRGSETRGEFSTWGSRPDLAAIFGARFT